ncbi:MAG: peptidoglycan-binding protein [Candidatus Pacebacteria bacterium]|nr:peptidoglycan-binding protein [Candidatus Paceibacterota bacterium]
MKKYLILLSFAFTLLGISLLFNIPSVHAFTYTDLVNFSGTSGSALGANPVHGNLIQASNGNLYGMTQYGGANNVGVIFSYNPTSSTYTKIYDFGDGGANLNGAQPLDSLIQASNGNLYGMTYQGGANNVGVVFSYNPTSSTYTKIYDFGDGGANLNGDEPEGSLFQASNGNLYGMTQVGGVNNRGVIFSYNPTTSTYTKLYDFDFANGSSPVGTLIQASNGNLYGLTNAGGAGNAGVIFSYNPTSSTYTKLYDFSPMNSGAAYPSGSLIQASNGNLYGLTVAGGDNNDGAIFSYNPTTSTYTKLYGGFNSSAIGARPFGSFFQASNGNLYGLTNAGGAGNAGVIFSYNSTSSIYTKIYDFISPSGAGPDGSILQASNGNLYGMTESGGANGDGVIFDPDLSPTQITSFDPISNINESTTNPTYINASAVESYLLSTYPNVTANSEAVTVPVNSWTDTDSYNSSVAGTYTFTAVLGTIPDNFSNSGNYTATVNVIVSSPTLSSIAITTGATKLTYNVGDTLDITGLVVTGTYSDSSTQVEPITTANISGFNSSAPATGQVLTITVNGKTTTYTINIVAVQVSSGGGGGGRRGGGHLPLSNLPVLTYTQCYTGDKFSTVTGLPCTSFTSAITPTNTSITPQYNFGTVLLQYGSIGPAVKELQRYFNDTLNSGLVLDGYFGSKTLATVKQWQKTHGLIPDGLVGPKTKAKMLSEK